VAAQERRVSAVQAAVVRAARTLLAETAQTVWARAAAAAVETAEYLQAATAAMVWSSSATSSPIPDWRPNPTVEIGGTDYTAQAIDRIRIFRGRRTVYERPNAGYASISLRDIGDMPDVQVGREVVVRIDDIYGIPFVLFTGTLSDWQSDAQPAQTAPSSPTVYRQSDPSPP
jgi:hypothetical protein